MNVVFLDIDGVLNHDIFYQETNQQKRYEEVGRHHCDLDPTRIVMLNDLVEKADAKFVISSTWRKGKTVEELQALLDWGGFKGEVIGKTDSLYIEYKNPNHPDGKSLMSVPRGVEIAKWLEDHGGLYNAQGSMMLNYVIFDDDSDMLYHQRNNFLLVDGYCGLTPSLIYKANYILTGRYMS